MAINKIPTKPTHRKRSPFYWWRRFPTHKPLSTTQPLLFRIQNGDFEYAPYFEQASWEDHWCEEEIKEKESLFMSMENYAHEKAHIQMRYAKRRGCPPTVEEQNILAALHHKNRPKRRGRPPKNFVL